MKQITITEQLDNLSFTLYDNHLGTTLYEFSGFEFADVIASMDDVAGPYGSVYVNSKFGKRKVSIKGDLVPDNGNDIFALRRELLKVLRQTGVLKLVKFTTYDDLELQFEAEVTRVTNPYNHKVHTFLIEMTAPDWRFYSQELKTFEIMQTVISGGASIPASIPMAIDLSSGIVVHSNILDNMGNETTDPIFTITGPGTHFTIENTTTGKSFVLDTTLADDDQVVIDVRNRTVVLNGITNLYGDFSGDFWSVEPGENEIEFFISSGDSPETLLSVEYRDAYTGI